MSAPTDEFLALLFQTCDRVGILIHAVEDSDKEIAPGNWHCRRGEKTHIYLPAGLTHRAQRNALLGALADTNTEDMFLPPIVREAIEQYDRDFVQGSLG